MHSDTDSAGPPRIRHPHIRAALPILTDDTGVDLAILERVAAALRVDTDEGRLDVRSDIPAAIERLRRDMGDTIADMWATSTEAVSCA